MKLNRSSDTLHFHLSPYSNEFWKEIGHLVADGFQEQGFTVYRHEQEAPGRTDDQGIHVAVGGHEYFNTLLKEEQLINEVAPRMIALTGEQPGSQWFSANLPSLSKCLECWDITQSGTEALRSRGLSARRLQLGYAGTLRGSPGKDVAKTRDVFFMGSLTHARARRIAEFGLDRAHLENHFQLVEIEYAKTSKDLIYLANQNRNTIARSSRITLNYHGHLIPFFEWHRALIAMANESLFITDPVRASEPLVAGRHYVSASSQLINHVVDFFLEHEEMRQEITAAAHSYITSELRMEQCIGRFVDGDDGAGRVAEPASPFPLIQRELKEYLRKSRVTTFGKNFADHCIQHHATVSSSSEKSEVVKKRNELAARLQREASEAERQPPYDQERFDGRRQGPSPIEVSVVISLYNYESTVALALDSLLNAVSDPDILEVIVVDDGSRDGSAEVARQWLAASPFQGCLICKHYNTGFISSRNIGIKESTGKFVAILDADNAFLPRGIDRLLKRAKETEADASYGIIICVGQDGRPAGLISEQAWDVRRLIFKPYIDAMALFRREKLLELGLYDMEMFQHGWFGWEDYELWLRLANTGSKVAFLPNFVALYRAHYSSMINCTNLFQGELVRYLNTKYTPLIKAHSHAHLIMGVPKHLVG